MIRLKANRCGYIGYTCEGIPAFVSGGAAAAPTSWDSLDETGSNGLDKLNNFLNIPGQACGFVTTLDAKHPAPGLKVGAEYAPEVTCLRDTNPKTTPYNWLDMYNKGQTPDAVRYHGLVDFAAVTSLESDHTTNYMLCSSALLPFKASGGERILMPGPLEPLLDTEFPPVDVENTTYMDAALDGVMAELKVNADWREWAMDHMGGGGGRPAVETAYKRAIAMRVKAQKEPACDQLAIVLPNAALDTIYWEGSSATASHTVSLNIGGGTFSSSGAVQTVADIEDVMDFDANIGQQTQFVYLSPNGSGGWGPEYTSTAGAATAGAVFLGTVTQLFDTVDGADIAMIEVKQATCEPFVPATPPATSEGFMYWYSGSVIIAPASDMTSTARVMAVTSSGTTGTTPAITITTYPIGTCSSATT